MNCKSGDLAVMVHSFVGNEGRLVEVIVNLGRLRFRNGHEFDDCWAVAGNFPDEPCPVAAQHGGNLSVPDRFLRPLRDPGDDARDETLAWKPVPQKVSA